MKKREDKVEASLRRIFEAHKNKEKENKTVMTNSAGGLWIDQLDEILLDYYPNLPTQESGRPAD